MTQVHARALTSTQIASGTACSKKSAFRRRRRRGSTFNMLYTSPQASRLETAAKVRQKPPCQWSDHPREGEATRHAKISHRGKCGVRAPQSCSQYVHHFCDDFKTLIDHSSITTMCAHMKPGAKDSAPGAHLSHGGFIGAHMAVIELWSIKVLKSSQK